MTSLQSIERRLLAAILVEEGVLAQVDALEVEDFSHSHHREVFETIRRLQARGESPDAMAICDEIQRRDFELDRNVWDWINYGWFGLLMLDTMPYPGPRTVTRLDRQTHVNNIAVDWTAYLKLQADGKTAFPGALTIDDFDDATLRQVTADLIAADVSTLRKFKHPQPENQDDHDRQARREEQAEWLREQRFASARRARGASRKRRARARLPQRISRRCSARDLAA